MPRSLIAPLLIAILLISIPALPQDRKQLSEDDIRNYLAQHSDCKAEGIALNHLEYFNFTGSSADEAVVVASTCATGTAGPDVHSVLSRQPDGSLTELKIPATTDKQYAVLTGRVFAELSVADGLLVQTFHDTSGRKDPLVIKYRWNAKDKEFETAEVKLPPRYKTSFDCDQAGAYIEAAICYSQELASLDVRVDQLYRGWFDRLNDADRDILRKEQKEWLRKRNLICEADWEVVGCLGTVYRFRALELGAFKHLHR
jgi:uncharacterized protein YecT (DUF1311 family)